MSARMTMGGEGLALPPGAGAIIDDLRERSPSAGNREVAAALRHAGYTGPISEILGALRAGSAQVVSRRGRDVSNRTSHVFDNDAKTMTRERNLLALVEQASELWDDDQHTRLRCDWAELMGETGSLTLAMLERAGVLAQGGFVGIDREPKIIDGFAASRPELKWIAGDVMDALGDSRLRRVGILNHDGYEMVGSSRIRPAVRLIAELARRGLRRFGAFVVFSNADLDAVRIHGVSKFSAALVTHAHTIAAVFAEALPPRRSLTGEMLLPAGSAAAVDDPGFTGMVGSFEIYRGKTTGHRMCNLRLVLR